MRIYIHTLQYNTILAIIVKNNIKKELVMIATHYEISNIDSNH